MSELTVIEVAMKIAEKNYQSDLYAIYFGDNFYIKYYKEVPLVIVSLKKGASKNAIAEYLADIPGFKDLHKQLFGKNIKHILLSENEYKKINDWDNFINHNFSFK